MLSLLSALVAARISQNMRAQQFLAKGFGMGGFPKKGWAGNEGERN